MSIKKLIRKENTVNNMFKNMNMFKKMNKTFAARNNVLYLSYPSV